jgi:endonuclease YncB( thermonuclease family)
MVYKIIHVMQKVFPLFLCTVFFASGCSAATFSAKVLWIIDGDSIVVLKNQKRIEVRLYGIDSPEWNQEFSKQARSCLSKAVSGKNVLVVPYYYDAYGRLVAEIESNGRNINGYLAAKGCAWVYPHFCKQEICDDWYKKQRQAKRDRSGLWKEENPVSPWIWKRMKKRLSENRVPEEVKK